METTEVCQTLCIYRWEANHGWGFAQDAKGNRAFVHVKFARKEDQGKLRIGTLVRGILEPTEKLPVVKDLEVVHAKRR